MNPVPDPFAAVFQPANVYPVRVIVFVVSTAEDSELCADIVSDEPFPLNVTVGAVV